MSDEKTSENQDAAQPVISIAVFSRLVWSMFVLGFGTFAAIQGFIQDLMGKEAYLEWERGTWLPTSPLWDAAMLVIFVWAALKISDPNVLARLKRKGDSV